MNITESLQSLWNSTGIANMILPPNPDLQGAEQILYQFGSPIMILVCLFLLWLGIKKQFEPLLLVPIAFGMLLVNIYGRWRNDGFRSLACKPENCPSWRRGTVWYLRCINACTLRIRFYHAASSVNRYHRRCRRSDINLCNK